MPAAVRAKVVAGEPLADDEREFLAGVLDTYIRHGEGFARTLRIMRQAILDAPHLAESAKTLLTADIDRFFTVHADVQDRIWAGLQRAVIHRPPGPDERATKDARRIGGHVHPRPARFVAR